MKTRGTWEKFKFLLKSNLIDGNDFGTHRSAAGEILAVVLNFTHVIPFLDIKPHEFVGAHIVFINDILQTEKIIIDDKNFQGCFRLLWLWRKRGNKIWRQLRLFWMRGAHRSKPFPSTFFSELSRSTICRIILPMFRKFYVQFNLSYIVIAISFCVYVLNFLPLLSNFTSNRGGGSLPLPLILLFDLAITILMH